MILISKSCRGGRGDKQILKIYKIEQRKANVCVLTNLAICSVGLLESFHKLNFKYTSSVLYPFLLFFGDVILGFKEFAI